MKYALLDTDFISKTYTVRIDADNHLIVSGFLTRAARKTFG